MNKVSIIEWRNISINYQTYGIWLLKCEKFRVVYQLKANNKCHS